MQETAPKQIKLAAVIQDCFKQKKIAQLTLTSDVKVAAAKKRPLGEMAAMWLCSPAASTEASCLPAKLNRRISFLAEQENRTPEVSDLWADCSRIACRPSCEFGTWNS